MPDLPVNGRTVAPEADAGARPGHGSAACRGIDCAVYALDDDPELLASVAWLLGTIGLEPVTMTSADAFLQHYHGDRPGCVMLDVRMPHMSGIRLQDILRERFPHVVIIFVSAHGDIRMSVTAMQRGAFSFLTKPYEPQALLDVVQAGMSEAEIRYSRHVTRAAITEKVNRLTSREREILRLVVEGLPSQQIARRLGVHVKTVDVHRGRIKSRTDSDSINTLVRDLLRYDIPIPN